MHKFSAFLFLTFLAIGQIAHAQLNPNPDFLHGARSYTYKSVDGVTLRLHVFSPHDADTTPKPAIVFFFGGGWQQGSVGQFVPHAVHLSNRGMVAIIADYRVLFRHGTSAPDALADAKSAMRWVRSHARELSIDPDRIAAAGGSAGGHLAAATAIIKDFDTPGENTSISARPNALVLFNPALDTGRIGSSRPAQFKGQGEAISPFHQIKTATVPTLIQHGTEDTTVPYSEVVAYCEEVKGLGGDCTLIGYEGATHGFFNKGRDNDRWYTPTLLEMDSFLHRLGYLE